MAKMTHEYLRKGEWKEPSPERLVELARQQQLSLADIIELTGFAPDRDGKIGSGILDADMHGIRFTLKESTIRGQSANCQIESRRLTEKYKLDLPCRPIDLIVFDDPYAQWQELAIPKQFAIEVLRAQGMTDVHLSYGQFQTLVEIPGHENYDQLRGDDRQVTRLVASQKWVEMASEQDEPEKGVAEEFIEDALLGFPTTMLAVLAWLQDQSGFASLRHGWVGTLALLAQAQHAAPESGGEIVKGDTTPGASQELSIGNRSGGIGHDICTAAKRVGKPWATASVRAELERMVQSEAGCVFDVATNGILYKDAEGMDMVLTWRQLKSRLVLLRKSLRKADF